MIRITTLLWVALLVIAGGTVMHVSYQVRHIDRHLTELATKTRQEQDAIRILGAEWDSLNDPRRIDALSKRYLSLGSTPIQRVVALEDIPLRPSAEQIAKLDEATAIKVGKNAGRERPTHKPAPDIKAAGPAVQVAQQVAPPPALGTSATPPVGVGLILARVERRE